MAQALDGEFGFPDSDEDGMTIFSLTPDQLFNPIESYGANYSRNIGSNGSGSVSVLVAERRVWLRVPRSFTEKDDFELALLAYHEQTVIPRDSNGFPIGGGTSVGIKDAELKRLRVTKGQLVSAPWDIRCLPEGPEGNFYVQVITSIGHAGLLADTDRNGKIGGGDYVARDRVAVESGALFAVNFDNDNHGADNHPDAITWWDDSNGIPKHENWIIENAADVLDITPLEIMVPPLPRGSKVYLTVGAEEQMKAIHVFGRVEPGREAIWGGILAENRPWQDTDEEVLDIDITRWANPFEEEDSDPAAGRYIFGVEGLAFRGMKVPGGTLGSGGFGGEVEFGLQITIPGIEDRLEADRVKLKVAPFLLNHNNRPTDKVFVFDIAGGLADPGNDPANPKPVMPKAVATTPGLPPEAGHQWFQDHVEIGYTQRPGGPLTKITYVCPYAGSLAGWPVTHLCGEDKGVFALGSDPSKGGGDYGGNIELSHPMAGAPLGKVLLGSQASGELMNFFAAQEVQQLAIVDVDFAEVRHVDEVLSPGPQGKTWYPDSAGAIQHLRNTFSTTQQKLEGVFFSTDQEKAKVTTTFAATLSNGRHYVITPLDYNTHREDWELYVGGYLRIVSTGTSGGQVARISAISEATQDDHPTAPGVPGKLKIEVSKVWNTCQTNAAGNRRASQHWNEQSGLGQVNWHVAPPQGVYVVCVKGSKFWREKCPAIITVEEVLADSEFAAFNETTLPSLVQNALSMSGVVNIGGLPCLFYKCGVTSGRPWKSVAFTPNAVNLQWVDGQAVLPTPFGPKNSQNVDVMSQIQQSRIQGHAFRFVDNWTYFHVEMGEVHCGSVAERGPLSKWWDYLNN